MPRIKQHLNKGFTLIELLTVVAIIGLLSAITVYGIQSARERAQNARTTARVSGSITKLTALEATSGSYPLTSGVFCLGGSNCGASYSALLNEYLGGTVNIDTNPMTEAVPFNSESGFRAWYARCNNTADCPNDDITEVVWFLKGATATCGLGATRCVSENGNVACIAQLSGSSRIINSNAIGYCYDEGGNSSSYE